MSKTKKEEEFEAEMEAARVAQNLPEGAVPERRPIASQVVDDPHSRVYKDLQEAGDDRAGAPAMDKAAYDRAEEGAAKQEKSKKKGPPPRLYPGARAFVDNEGEPDHGRAVAVNRVAEWKSFEDQMRGSSGFPDQNNTAEAAVYECTSRDGRGELMLISAEHLRIPAEQGDWGRTSIS